jgi:hypothetical protein
VVSRHDLRIAPGRGRFSGGRQQGRENQNRNYRNRGTVSGRLLGGKEATRKKRGAGRSTLVEGGGWFHGCAAARRGGCSESSAGGGVGVFCRLESEWLSLGEHLRAAHAAMSRKSPARMPGAQGRKNAVRVAEKGRMLERELGR